MHIQLTAGKKVFNGCAPYIIAEIGSNHNGDMDLGERLIKAAKEAGADCVKFQSWAKDSIFSKAVFENNPEKEELADMCVISEDQLRRMREACRRIGIDFASTPFSEREADYLSEDLDALDI